MEDEKKATNIYILSIPRIPGEYKLGIHRGDLKKLYQRYETSVHDVQVHYFFKNVDALTVEQKILKQHDALRIVKKRTGRKSEWMTIELHELLLDLMMAFIDHATGRDHKGTFIIDSFNRTREDQTTILEACGHGIPMGKSKDNYVTFSEEEESSISEEEVIEHMKRLTLRSRSAPKERVSARTRGIRNALSKYVKIAKSFETARFHQQFKAQYTQFSHISAQKIAGHMAKLGWERASISGGNRRKYVEVINLEDN